MKKALKIIGIVILGLGIFIGITIWRSWQKQQKAQSIADRVIENLASEDIYKEFPEKQLKNR